MEKRSSNLGFFYTIFMQIFLLKKDGQDAKFSPGTPVSFTYKTDVHDITEILLKVALNTKTHQIHMYYVYW